MSNPLHTHQHHTGCCGLAQVAANPLNFSKPCMISSRNFPLESVFLGGAQQSSFATAVLQAQKGCISTQAEKACNANTTSLDRKVLDTAMAYAASQVNSTSVATTGAAAAYDLSASWGLPGALSSGPAHEHPASPAPTLQPQASNSPPTATVNEGATPAANTPIGIAGEPAALAPLGAAVLSPFDAMSASMSAIFKNKGAWLTLVQPPELNSIFGTAEYSPIKANTPGTKAALSFLKILLRRRP